jgi:hypothetical protein
MEIRLSLLVMLAALSSCASSPPQAPREFIDEQTANTLLVVTAPLVFARDRSDIAARARDYVNAVALEVDTAGQYRQYLLTYRWSTVDPRMAPPPPGAAGALLIIADGREIPMKPLDRLPVGMPLRAELLVPNHGVVSMHAYAVDVQTLHFIAASRSISLRLPQEPLDIPFGLWEDGRGALSQFLTRAATR